MITRLMLAAVLLCGALAAQSETEAAEGLISAAQALAGQKSPEALHEAATDYERAAGIWQKLGAAPKQVEALAAAARASYALHDPTKTADLLTSALEVARASNLPVSTAMLLESFAALHQSQGQFSKAIEEYGSSGEIYKQLGDSPAETRISGFRANLWRMQGNAAEKVPDIPAALEAHRQAAILFEQIKDYKRAGQEYLRLGQISRNLETPVAREQSAGFLQTAIPLLEAAKDRFDQAVTYWALGSVADSLGQSERSRDALLKALPLLEELKDPKARGTVLQLLAKAEDKLGDLPKAVEHYEQALPLFAAANDQMNRFVVGMKLGAAEEALGHHDQALAAYRAVVTSAHAAGNDRDEAIAQGTIGVLEFASRDWTAAMEAAVNAQQLHAKLGDAGSEAGNWLMIGSIDGRQGKYQEKLTADLRALELIKGNADRHTEVHALTEVGDAYSSLHQNQQAIEYLEKARALGTDDDAQRAEVLVELGEVYYDQTRLDKALDLENQALEIALQLNHKAFVTKIQNDLALTLQAKGEMTKAGRIYEAGLADARERQDVQQIYTALNNLAKLRQDLGDNQKSAKLFEESLNLAKKDGDQAQVATTLDSLGTTYHLLGQDDKALATLNQSLSEWRALGDENGQAISLNNLALIYDDMGRPQQAIEAMSDALSKRRALSDDAEISRLLRGLGGIYQGIGDYDRAQSYFTQALDTQKKFGDEYAQGTTHNSLGVLLINRHEAQAAVREFDQALLLMKKFGDARAEATTLSNLANADLDLSDFAGAETKFNQSLAIAMETKNVDLQALALHGLGSVYERTNRLKLALDKLRQALALWRDLGNSGAESKALSLVTQVELNQGNLEAARKDVDESIRIIESQRATLGSEDLRAYYLASISGPYKLRVDVLMAMDRAHPGQGWNARAFEACERSRARSLLDLLAESHIDLQKHVDPKLASEDRALQTSIAAKAVVLHKLAPDSEDLKPLQLALAELTGERERIAIELHKASPELSTLRSQELLTLRDIQSRVLDPQSILLEYSLGEKRSYLFAVTSKTLGAYELPKQSELVNAAVDVFSDFQRPELDRTEASQNASALSRTLLGPVAGQLEGKRLLIVADGELALLPFAALQNPLTGQLLVINNEIVALPSASTLFALRAETGLRKKPLREIAVIADPVFEATDPRLGSFSTDPNSKKSGAAPDVLDAAVRYGTRGSKRLVRLDHSDEEARAILALSKPNESVAMLGLEASKRNVMNGRLAEYRILHFATHGLVDPENPQLSGLVLSLYDDKGQATDGFLDMNAIFDMKLQADLVVLSACESGQGKLVGGEGLMSLSRAFLNAGARSLVVSGWSVDDEATSELMKRFYQGVLGPDELRPAAALRNAQRSMLNERRWADPYYWAAFTFQGNWRGNEDTRVGSNNTSATRR